MYAICGATGNIGRVIAENLLAQGKKVRVIGRSAERLQPLVDKGAEPIVADLTDTEALTRAFSGAKAVYAMIPPNYQADNFRNYQNKIGASIADAIMKADVKYVVNLSSIGAHLSEGVGPVNGLHDQEERLDKLEGVNVIHLRPAFFMENHLWQVDTIKQQGMIASTQNSDMPWPQIATSDIAEYAQARLTQLDFKGKMTRELLGPEDVSMTDVTRAISQAIGKDDLSYTQISYDDARAYMTGAGMSKSAVDDMIELEHALNEGTCTPTEPRTPENTTPTTIRDFSKTFAQLYKG